jgi:sulfopyruvate decarboxylase TPP-binding subunit
MNDTAEAQYATDGMLSGASILAAVKAARIEYVLSVPDITSSKGLLRPIAQDPDLKLIRVCKEDECIGIASGLAHGRKRALILIQNTGFYDSINAIRGVGIEFGRPICMMVGLLERDVGVPLKDSKRYAIRIMEPMLDVLGIERHLIEDAKGVAAVAPAIERCYAESKPMVLLLGRRPA